MSDRTAEDIRTELAAERERLNDDLTRLKSDLRALAGFMAAGLVVVALVTWFLGKRRGAQAVWRLVK
jgi:hypothetical protein